MGLLSRKCCPAVERMLICCPALRSSSRRPVKRYKKLITEIFPKSPNGQPNERKIVKLCEYAAKNPGRIPKITKLLEDRLHKSGQLRIISIVMEAYNKLLCTCGKQMAYFAASLLNLSNELLDRSKQISVQKVGCQSVTQFIYSQTDGTYAHNIERFVKKVCALARETGEEHDKRILRASCLQCLSAMLWYMAQFSYIFNDIVEIVQVTLDNYEGDARNEERAEPRHHWVDEVVRCAGGGVAAGASACSNSIRAPPERKNISSLTSEEAENPKVWGHICLQRMAELAKESSTMRHVLEPMFVYFDTRRHWSTQQGLAMIVLCDMSYFIELPEKQLVILNGLIRHLDHKNVVHDPIVKSCVVQVAATLARQMRSGATLADIGCVVDLLRHLRKSLQATAGPIGEEETNLNVHLQNSIESCLLEIAKGINDATPLFDLMVIALEKLPPAGVIARATLSSVLILAHVSVAVYSHLQQVFPEALLLQLLKAMLHQDTEARILAHKIFSILLFPSSWRSYETRKWESSSKSTSASVTALLEKLRKEKDSKVGGTQGDEVSDDCRGRNFSEDECKQAWNRRSSPNFYKLTSFIDRNAAMNNSEEPSVMKLSEDQILQLLSGFWIQASLSDNLPSNFEVIAHSYCLTLISSQIKSTSHSLVALFFQLPLSLRQLSLHAPCGMLPSACRRSIFMTSTAMLMFAARMYQILELNDVLRSQFPFDADPFLGINEDLQVYVKPQADVRKYGSALDNQIATSFLTKLQSNNIASEKVILDTIVRYLCCITKMEEVELLNQLSSTFSPDEAFMFAPKELRELDHMQLGGHLKESPSLDGNFSVSSVAEDDVTSAFASVNILGQKASPSPSPIMSIGQLLESALEVAGQVVGTSVSTSPLPYSTMAGHCEALEIGTRQKLSNWLSQENINTGNSFVLPADGQPSFNQVLPGADPLLGDIGSEDQHCALRLPPASPFDNFIQAVAGPKPMLAGMST